MTDRDRDGRDDVFDGLSDETKGIIDREGVPQTETSPFEMDDDEFADWLADVLGRVRGAELTTDERTELRSIVAEERHGINQWLLNSWANVRAGARSKRDGKDGP